MVNPAAQQMLGLVSDEVIGHPIQDVVSLQSLVLALEDTLQTERGHLVELELDQPTRRIVRAHTAALKGSGPYVGGALGLIYDITELRHLERVRTDFVANVSHELRTPLTSIHGFTETLLDGADEDPETRRRFLQIINRETERVTAIINDLLDLSRLESDQLEVNWSILPLRRLIEETLPLVADVAEQKHIELLVNADPQIRVRADEALLRQVFINLLDNAVKYTPDSGGKVTVDAEVRNGGRSGHLVRYGHRHSPRRFAPYFRAVLSRGQSPFPADGRHGPRSFHRAAHRGKAGRHHPRRKRAGQGNPDDFYAAACAGGRFGSPRLSRDALRRSAQTCCGAAFGCGRA